MKHSIFKSIRSILILLSVFYLVSCIMHPASVTAESLSDIKLDALSEPSLFLSFSHLFLGLSDIKLDALDKPIKEKWGRDPFIRYEDKTAKLKGKTFREDVPADLKISGIISDGKKAVAIINGGFYRKNEKINNFLIVDIAKDRVSLEKNGKRFYLGVEKFTMDTYMDTYKDKDMPYKKDNVMDDGKEKDKKEDKEAKK
ncbi:MAG: hypothetical protein Q8N12_02985 [Thermodesulfovibrionales bacterium]|nr:hypothetical protein [Thermodesulfovibrionales bacterium]